MANEVLSRRALTIQRMGPAPSVRQEFSASRLGGHALVPIRCGLETVACLEQSELSKIPADHLQTDRQACLGEAARHAKRR